MPIAFHGLTKPTEAPAPRASKSMLRPVYADMKPGQWYLVATSDSGSRELHNLSSGFRQLGAQCSVRTSNGLSKLYVLRNEPAGSKAPRR